MIASELIPKALRLINVPGRGATLSADDQQDAFEALQTLLDSEAVSKAFVPGIRRHFFNMTQGKAIYSYGASAQADFRSDDFDDDPAPIKIEDAYIRAGSSITNNELIDEYRFENVGSWVLDANASITNNQFIVEAAITTSTVVVAPTAATTYTLRVSADVINGTFEIRLREAAVAFETYVIDSTGEYTFDVVWPAFVTPDVEIATTLATDDIKINSLSLIERGKERLELPDSRGSDYSISVVDQKLYNRRFTKGTGGRPYQILYSHNYPLPELRFDNSSIAGDILVMDVLVNRVAVTSLSSPIRMKPSSIEWLKYALADRVAGEYGKALRPDQVRIMSDAWSKLSVGNQRMNMLRVDRALRRPPTFDINRGDP